LIYNYSVNADPLSKAVWSGIAIRIGRDIEELEFNTSKDVDNGAHIMSNFYRYFK